MKKMGLLSAALALPLVLALAGCGEKIGAAKYTTGASGKVMLTGKNYTMNKDTDFRYDLIKIDGEDYVVIEGINAPVDFNGNPEDVDGEDVLVDTLTVKIPEKIEDYTVGAIKSLDPNSGSMASITSVIIPDTVVAIGEEAFRGSSISSIKLPKDLKILGAVAFAECKYLGGPVTIPEGVTEIPNGVFFRTKITEVIIPEGVTVIGRQAFENCSELVSVKLPAHPIKYPESYYTNDAFRRCGRLSLAIRAAITASGYTSKF